MKILHVVYDHFSRTSGYSIRTAYIIRYQQELGLHLSVVVAPYQNYIGNGINRIGKVTLLDGVPFYQTGMTPSIARILISLSPWLYRRMEGLFLEQYIFHVAKLENSLPDLIHAHSSHQVGWSALRAARRLGLPFVYEMRGLWEESAVANGRFSEYSYLYRFHRMRESQLVRQANGLVVISKALLQEMNRRGVAPNETVVVSNAVASEMFLVPETMQKDRGELRRQLGIEENAVLVGYVGSLNHYESLDDVVQAILPLKGSNPVIKLVLVGDGEARPGLEVLVNRLGLGRRVIFVGQVTHQEVVRYYDAIDIFVVARNSKHVSLVMPLKPLEALARAKPLIIADLPVMHEIIQDGETGLFYPAGNIEMLTAKILQLAGDPALRIALGQNGRAWALENCTWEKVVGQYQTFYQHVITAFSKH